MYRSGVRRSVCPFRYLTAASAGGGFAAERRAGMSYRSTATGAGRQQQRRRSTALSRKRGSDVLTAELTRL